ncbi:MAG: hypothetical protein BWY21_01001 [Parcubacteria group bacterium ADurb.Bin216]|nr:MAG: hypothetical protein BWY21_01001 [Parcubacteria group bacterium ADurb.Bin216]
MAKINSEHIFKHRGKYLRLLDTDEGFFLEAKDLITDSIYYKGPYNYRDSAMRWAKANVDKLFHLPIPEPTMDNSLTITSDTNLIKIPIVQVSQEDIDTFKLIYGEDTPYLVSDDGTLVPDTKDG